MDITTTPNLKPWRQYSEYDVINMFTHADADESTDVLKSTFVTISAAEGNTNVAQNTGTPVTPFLATGASYGNAPSRAVITDYNVTWTVDTASTADPILGMMLYDMKSKDEFGQLLKYQPDYKRHEMQVVLPGEAVPIVTGGFFLTNNFVGDPAPGDIAEVGATTNVGKLTINNSSTNPVGMFLSSADADGYVFIQIRL